MYLTPTRPAMGAATAWAASLHRACLARLPTELWGAVNAVRRAIASPNHPKLTAQRTHHTAAAGTTEPLLTASQVTPPTFPGPRPDLVAVLNTLPVLTLLEALVCLLVTGVVCTATYVAVFGFAYPLNLRAAVQMGGLAAISLTTLRSALLQHQYQALQREPHELGDADSLFLPLLGVLVHAKASHSNALPGVVPTAAPTHMVGVHCYHGFGANTASWDLLRPQLAASLRGLVTCHDMPGFGLTSRPTQLSRYSLSFNGALGRSVLDRQGQVGARVLVGHSLGAACVAAEVINNPKGIDAVVLVAPAIVAPRGGPAKGVAAVERAAASPGASVASPSPVPSLPPSIKHRVLLAPALVTLARALLLLLRPLLVLLLRSAVHSRRFWEKGIKSSWFDASGVTPQLVDSYRLPQLVKGWESGMLCFLYARTSILSPIVRGSAASSAAEGDESQLARFSATVAEAGIPVLIIHGADDTLVPLSNSKALASTVPGAQLVVLPGCGHTPQEETPDRVTEHVCAFLKESDVTGGK